MRKVTVLFAVAGCLALATSAMATIPSPSNSSCVFEVKTASACADADAIWCPGGDFDTLCVRVTVRNALDDPLDSCSVRFDVSASSNPDGVVAANLWLCGSTAGALTLNGMSDANGAVAFKMNGGGCGALELQYTVTAECAIPEVELCADTLELCVKSVDFNGDGSVNFFDTFKYLPQLNGGTGYCGNLNCDAGVNFFDTFKYLPHLNGAGNCAGATIPLGAAHSCP